MALPLPVVRRLALIRYMHREGVEQARRPTPASAIALLTFHDAVELFLHLACELHQASPKGKSFMDYFPALSGVANLAQKPGMDRLNKARVSFKHHGNLPHEDDLEFFRFAVQAFFDENTPALFYGLLFSDVSLTDMVTCEKARALLTAAEDHWRNGKRQDACGGLALAFDELMWDYAQRNLDPETRRMPLHIGPSLRFLSASRLQLDREPARFVEDVLESIKSMRSALEVMALGIDYRKYVEFYMLTPSVHRAASGSAETMFRSSRNLTHEEYARCFGFVIETALKLQEFDFAFAAAKTQQV